MSQESDKKASKLSDETWAKLFFHKNDTDLWPSSEPKKRPMGTKNKTHKRRNGYRKPTEQRAIRYSTESEGW